MTPSTLPSSGRTLGELERALRPAGARLLGGGEMTRVTDVVQDSRRAEQGALFVARAGGSVDGHSFALDAVQRGAVAVLCEPGTVDFEPRIEVSDLPLGWALAAHEVQGCPSRELSVIGITGTNGKTTTACLLEQALLALGARPSRLGTLGFFVGGDKWSDTLTTPQADDVARYLAQALQAHASHMVMEVSSHALAQGRVLGVEFAVAAFTNLSQDHLDFHGTLDAYAATKLRLLDELAPKRRVINVGDAWGARFAEELGLHGSSDLRVTARERQGAEIVVTHFERSALGLSARLRIGAESVELHSPLVGEHNLENLVVALGCLLSLGFPVDRAVRSLETASGAPGRLERCDAEGDDVTVLVDYAHTPDALARCLEAVSSLGSGRVTCLFGCGGDRDRTKRPLMGAVAVANAARVVVTSDNPRTEPPEQIIEEIRPGLSGAAVEILIEPDRARAIEQAIVLAQPGDIVLLAGKGHETYQILADRVIDFDDRREARRSLALRRARRGPRGILEVER